MLCFYKLQAQSRIVLLVVIQANFSLYALIFLFKLDITILEAFHDKDSPL